MRAAVVLTGFLMLTLPLMPVQQLFKWTWPAMARRLPHYYHWLLARLLGFRVTTVGEVPGAGPVLLVSNHVSWIDIVVFSATLPVSFIAKKEVGGWPLFGQMAKLQRTVFVDRQRRHKAAESLHEIAKRLGRGDILVLFPEGTSHDGKNMLPFKSALFGVMELDDIPVVPVALTYTRIVGLPMTHRQRPAVAWYGDMELPPHLWEVLKAGPIEAVLTFHPPVAKTGRKELSKLAEATIRESLASTLHGRR